MTTTVRVQQPGGAIYERLPDGSERLVEPNFPDAMTDEEVIAAALTDPNNPPLTDEQLARMKPVALSKRIRWKLGLSREDFARTFSVPLDIVIAWERYQAEPDDLSRSYLRVILADPEAALRALDTPPPHRSAAE